MQHDALRAARATLAALPIWAQGLAGFNHDVHVVIDPKAGTASTNGKRITLPPMPLPTSSSDLATAQRLAVLAYGFIPHEVGHVRHSDFEAIKTAMQESPLVAQLLNGIEDPRQEAVFIGEYPGTRQHLDALTSACINTEGFYKVLSTDDSPAWLVTAYAMYVLRGLLRNQPEFTDLAEASRPALEANFGEGFVTRLDVLLAVQGPKLASTADALTLARRITAVIEEAAEPPQPESPQGDTGDDGDEGEGQQQPGSGGDGADQDDAEQGASQDSAGDGEAGTAGQQPTATDAQRQALKAALDAGDGEGLQDLGDQVSDAINKAIQKMPCAERVAEDPRALQLDRTHPDGAEPLLGGAFDEATALQHSGRLRALLQQHFQAQQLQRDHETVRGKFNPRRAFRTSQGDRRMFLRVDDRPGLNTALFILVDASSSMNEGKMQLAAEAAFVSAVAINGLGGTDCAVGMFPGYGMLLPFGQRASMNTPRFAVRASGNTPMAEGLLWAGRKLVARPQQRKIMLVATDGEPNSRIAAQAQIDALERAGVEVMGLGIGTSSVQHLFKQSAVIDSIHEVSRAMLEIVGNTLRRHLAAAA